MTREEVTMGVRADGGHNMDWGDVPGDREPGIPRCPCDTEGGFNKAADVKAELSLCPLRC